MGRGTQGGRGGGHPRKRTFFSHQSRHPNRPASSFVIPPLLQERARRWTVGGAAEDRRKGDESSELLKRGVPARRKVVGERLTRERPWPNARRARGVARECAAPDVLMSGAVLGDRVAERERRSEED